MVSYLQDRFIPAGGQTLRSVADVRTKSLMEDLIAEFKPHARIDWHDEDSQLSLYLRAAIYRIEQYTLLPILPVSYEWSIDPEFRTGATILLPMANTSLAGDQFGFELLIAPKRIPMPTVWPVVLEVGFVSGTTIPHDMIAAIFAIALGLYEYRSSHEMQEVHSRTLMAVTLGRYWVPRV